MMWSPRQDRRQHYRNHKPGSHHFVCQLKYLRFLFPLFASILRQFEVNIIREVQYSILTLTSCSSCSRNVETPWARRWRSGCRHWGGPTRSWADPPATRTSGRRDSLSYRPSDRTSSSRRHPQRRTSPGRCSGGRTWRWRPPALSVCPIWNVDDDSLIIVSCRIFNILPYHRLVNHGRIIRGMSYNAVAISHLPNSFSRFYSWFWRDWLTCTDTETRSPLARAGCRWGRAARTTWWPPPARCPAAPWWSAAPAWSGSRSGRSGRSSSQTCAPEKTSSLRYSFISFNTAWRH